ncbi:hypothetical protein ACMA5I_02660 [Paracoccaceae bacterium GXU_MW_L88]
MIRYLCLAAALPLFACGPTPEKIAAMPFPEAEYQRVAIDGDLLLFLEEGSDVDDLAPVIARYPEVSIGRTLSENGWPIVLVYVPKGQESAYARELMKEDIVLRAERNWAGQREQMEVSVGVL